MQHRVEREYGPLDPRSLWNASYAAGADRWALGSLEAMCAALAPEHVRTVAIVGNGPLTQEQRELIRAKDRIMRFNAVNNM